MSFLVADVETEGRPAATAILGGCVTASLRPGRLAAAESLRQARLVAVESGIVALCSLPPAAERRMIAAVAGEGSLLAPPAGHEHVLALTDARLTLVSASELAALLALPEVGESIVTGLLDAVRDRQESLAQFASVKHARRVEGKLMQLARAHGRVVAGGVRLDVPLTHELLGDMVGSARETVTWALGELAREGVLVREGRRYRLSVEPERLAS